MSQLSLLEGLLLNLKGEIEERRREYLPREDAYRSLKLHTGQDFGDDIEKWEAWIKTNPKSVKAQRDVKSQLSKYL